MTASRKLYTDLARRFKDVANGIEESDSERGMWRVLALATAFALRADNSNFDKRRFLQASGFTEDELRAYADTY